MTHFYESDEDLALRGKGVITGEDLFSNLSNISSMDLADFIESTWGSVKAEDAEDEYRDERSSSERQADKYGCWCILTARDILCATIYITQHIACAGTYAAHAVYLQHTHAAHAVYNTHHAVYNTRYAAYNTHAYTYAVYNR